MKTRARKNPDGSLTLINFDLMAPLKKGEKGLKRDIDVNWMKEAAANFKRMQAASVGTYTFYGHNEKEKPAPQISQAWGDVYVDEQRQRLVASEITINDPESVAKLLNGRLPRRSAEFTPEPPFIAGVALMDAGVIGHQNYSGQLPDTVLEVLCLSQGETLIMSGIEEPIELELDKEKPMALDPEMKAEIVSLIREVLTAGKEEVAATVKEEVALALKTEMDTVGPESVKLIDNALAKHKLELDQVKTESDIDSKVHILLANTANVLTETQLRKMFTDEKTLKKYGGRAGLFEYMKLQNEVGTVKLSSELINTGPNVDRELGEEFDRMWPNDKMAPMTKLEYINSNRDTFKMLHA